MSLGASTQELKDLNATIAELCQKDGSVGKDIEISYESLSTASRTLGGNILARQYLSPVSYLRLSSPLSSKITRQVFVNFVNSKVRLDRLHVQLQLYDLDRTGYLREADLETFIFDMIPTMTGLSELSSDFHQFYVFTAARKFMFFLDPKRSGRVSIREILASKILEEFRCLTDASGGSTNWFSVESASTIYSRYIDMDLNSDGLLSKDEIVKYPGALLTQITVDRLLQEHMSFQSMLDYKGYLDLVLALSNPALEVSVRYIWKLLDINRCGQIGLSDIQPFLRSIFETLHTAIANSTYHLYMTENIFREMVDSAGVHDRDFLTLQDLMTSAKNSIFIAHHLVDAQAFYQHDNRETPQLTQSSLMC